MDKSTSNKNPTPSSYRIETASGDSKYYFYLYHDNHKYGIRFESSRNIVNEPKSPQYLRNFKRAVKQLEKTGESIIKFSIVGVVGKTKCTDKGLKLEFVFPGLMNLIMPFVVTEPSKEELDGKVGLRAPCIMESLWKTTS